MAAPLYAKYIAGRGPTRTTSPARSSGAVSRRRRHARRYADRPGLSKQYLLGADANGRDVAVRILYGGRNSLFVGFIAAMITTLLAVSLG